MASNEDALNRLPAVMERLQITNERAAEDAKIAQERALVEARANYRETHDRRSAEGRANVLALERIEQDIENQTEIANQTANSTAGRAIALKAELEAQGKVAEDNKEYSKLSFKARKEDFKERLANAETPAAKKQIKEDMRADAKKNGSRLDKIGAGIAGMWASSKKVLIGGATALLSTLAIGGLLIALGKFLQSDTFKDLTKYIEKTLLPEVISFAKKMKEYFTGPTGLFTRLGKIYEAFDKEGFISGITSLFDNLTGVEKAIVGIAVGLQAAPFLLLLAAPFALKLAVAALAIAGIIALIDWLVNRDVGKNLAASAKKIDEMAVEETVVVKKKVSDTLDKAAAKAQNEGKNIVASAEKQTKQNEDLAAWKKMTKKERELFLREMMLKKSGSEVRYRKKMEALEAIEIAGRTNVNVDELDRNTVAQLLLDKKRLDQIRKTRIELENVVKGNKAIALERQLAEEYGNLDVEYGDMDESQATKNRRDHKREEAIKRLNRARDGVVLKYGGALLGDLGVYGDSMPAAISKKVVPDIMADQRIAGFTYKPGYGQDIGEDVKDLAMKMIDFSKKVVPDIAKISKKVVPDIMADQRIAGFTYKPGYGQDIGEDPELGDLGGYGDIMSAPAISKKILPVLLSTIGDIGMPSPPAIRKRGQDFWGGEDPEDPPMGMINIAKISKKVVLDIMADRRIAGFTYKPGYGQDIGEDVKDLAMKMIDFSKYKTERDATLFDTSAAGGAVVNNVDASVNKGQRVEHMGMPGGGGGINPNKFGTLNTSTNIFVGPMS